MPKAKLPSTHSTVKTLKVVLCACAKLNLANLAAAQAALAAADVLLVVKAAAVVVDTAAVPVAAVDTAAVPAAAAVVTNPRIRSPIRFSNFKFNKRGAWKSRRRVIVSSFPTNAGIGANQAKNRCREPFYRQAAKPPRAQRTYSKIKSHPFGEAIDHLVFDSDFCFSLRLCALAVEV
jgi:hypothetical protein